METSRKPRILVVDDDRRELERTLEAIRKHGIGYEARVALGGFEGLDYLLGRGRFHERRLHPLPDLVLLDLGMEPLDGAAVLDIVNSFEHLRHIQVVILCKSDEERERVARETAGKCVHAPKPLSPESFHDVLLQVAPWTLASNNARCG